MSGMLHLFGSGCSQEDRVRNGLKRVRVKEVLYPPGWNMSVGCELLDGW